MNGVNQQRITSTASEGPSSQCGMINNDNLFSLSYTISSHSTDSVEIKFISNFDSATTDESWGVREINIYAKKCDTSCLTCSGPTSSECLSCHFNAKLTAGVCTCRDYYYLKDQTLPCGADPCAACQRCHITCKTCYGPSSSNCLSCESQDTFDNVAKTCSYPSSKFFKIT